MSILPSAKQSPRVENGVIYWYENDTFSLQLELELEDQDGDEIVAGGSDEIKIVFIDQRLEAVKTFTFDELTGNVVTLVFDTAVTALFPKGRYTYDVYFTHEERTTVANDNKVLVE